MNVSLTPQLEELVKRKVATGMYHSASEVIREALRLLEEREAMQAVRLENLRRDIADGVAALDNHEGRPLDIKAIKQRGRQTRDQNAK
ncbi:MAG: type II toxin-antitoxin system ParD family antitoxin [Nitrosospira sp.]|nr:type II toxin-antitoxin system ParD family antitoxin [Nitrosospira sp.]